MKPAVTNRHVVLEAPTRNPDGAGGYVESWDEVGQMWVYIKASTGRESSANLLTKSSVRYQIWVRGAGVTSPQRPKPEQRFRDGGRIYRIVAVKEADSFGRQLICHAEEEVVA